MLPRKAWHTAALPAAPASLALCLKAGLIGQGKDYYHTEAERLERLVSGGKASPSKMNEILSKLSVLSAFKSDDTSAEE